MKSVDALSNDLRKGFKPMSPKIGVDFDAEVSQMMEKNYETIRWLEEIQTEQFIKLITGSDEFSAKLKKGDQSINHALTDQSRLFCHFQKLNYFFWGGGD